MRWELYVSYKPRSREVAKLRSREAIRGRYLGYNTHT